MLRIPPLRSASFPPLRSLAAALLAVLLLVGLVPATPVAAASKSLALTPGASSWATIGSSRTTSIASVAVTVPSAVPLEVGVQFRASSHASGYRAELAIGSDGSVAGSFSRVKSGARTSLGTSTPLGLTVKPGQVVHLEAAVAASKPVRLYLRAWLDGTIKVPNWQLSASDSSSGRITKAGKTYLWAAPDAGTQATKLVYGSVSVKSYSASKAAAVGVVEPEPNSDTFSIAVLPDTQAETNDPANRQFLNRVNWMVANKDAFDLRYVLHTGDVTNWGWLDPAQLTRAKAAMTVLNDAGLPYALTVGNHDTEAVGWNNVAGSSGYGGSAYMNNPECPSRLGAAACKSWLLLRHTEAFNKTFPLSGMGGVGGAYEAGKVDNYWTTFSANGSTWLVLTLELWPRKEVVAWARDVVASHPEDNVIIQTHNYVTRKGGIEGSNGGYGATSPRYLYDQVVSKYSNVKLVFSGHTGGFTSRVDKPHGNTVLSFLGNQLGRGDNPVRIVTVNTRTGDVYSTVYDPIDTRTAGSTHGRISIIR